MIWKAKPEDPRPQEGDYKIVDVFAWWPTKVNDKMVWLESYQEMYEYTVRERPLPYLPGMGGVYYGVFGGWDKIGQRVKRGMPIYDNPPPPPNSNEQQKELFNQVVKQVLKERFK